jgi:hypothetical protein
MVGVRSQMPVRKRNDGMKVKQIATMMPASVSIFYGPKTSCDHSIIRSMSLRK